MWPTYTNIGTDDRSQFDLFEAMPGGIEGVRRVVDELHAAGVKVLIPYNPWDAGTLRCGVGMATCGGNANLTAETANNPDYVSKQSHPNLLYHSLTLIDSLSTLIYWPCLNSQAICSCCGCMWLFLRAWL